MERVQAAVRTYFDCLKAGSNNLIDCQQFKDRVDAGEEQFILDIRKKVDYDKGHIEGAFHAEWSEGGEFIDEGVFHQGGKVVVVCYTGQTAGQVVSLLKILGYDACSLKGGMVHGWNLNDMPVEASCST